MCVTKLRDRLDVTNDHVPVNTWFQKPLCYDILHEIVVRRLKVILISAKGPGGPGEHVTAWLLDMPGYATPNRPLLTVSSRFISYLGMKSWDLQVCDRASTITHVDREKKNSAY